MKRIVTIAVVLACVLSLGAEEINFGFRPIPPYVMKDKNGVFSGIEYDIVIAALAVKGHTVKPSDYPLARLVATIKAKSIQGAAPILPSHDTGATLSDSYLTYNNVALALKKKNYAFKSAADLKGLGVIAFQTARAVLGPDFASAMEGNSKYVEEGQQVVQIKTLFAERVDVAIGESRILAWFIKAPETGVDSATPVQEFRIFNPTYYCAAFTDPKLAADFNAGLKAIKANGTFDKIIAKYTK